MVSFLTTLFLGKSVGAVRQYLVSIYLILSSETDNSRSEEDGNSFSTKECVGREDRSRDGLHTKWKRYRPSNRARLVDMYLERILTNASFVLTTATMADMLHVYSFAFGLHECLELRSFSLKT